MAEQFLYKCNNCDFQIVTNDSGYDVYMSGYGIQLYKCAHCNNIQSIDVGYTEMARKEILSERELFGDEYPRCKKCESIDLMRWNPVEHSCPQCDGQLIKDSHFIMYTD